MSNPRLHQRGFTLMEIMFATAAAVIVGGAVFVGVISLEKNFRATTNYTDSNAAQIRIIDHIATDLRSAIQVSKLTSGSAQVFPTTSGSATQWFTISSGTQLQITQPGYYINEDKNSVSYTSKYSLITDGYNVSYGSSSSQAPNRVITYSRSGQNYLRTVNVSGSTVLTGTIATDPATDSFYNWTVDVTTTRGARSVFYVEVIFPPIFRKDITKRFDVASSDRILLRNPRTD